MLKVLHVTSGIDERGGGTTTALLAMAEAQHDIGLDVSVVSMFSKDFCPTVADRLKAGDIPVTLIGPHDRPLAGHRDVGRLLPSLVGAADIVHIHALWESIQHQAAVLCRRTRKPHLFTTHGMLDPWSLSQSRWKKRLYLALRLRRDLESATAIHFTNDLERNQASAVGLRNRTVIEKYIIDCRDFTTLPPANTFRSRYPQLQGKRVLLFLGRLHRKKGLDLLLPAFAASEPRDAMLVLAGPIDDDYRAELTGKIAALGLSDLVLFTGMLTGEQRVAAFAEADVFTLPSHQENVGIAIIESLAAKTPVIISDRVNIYPDIAKADVGLVVPTQVEPLTKAISELLNHDQRRKEMSARASEFVSNEYDRLKLARRWRDHYEDLIAASQATHSGR